MCKEPINGEDYAPITWGLREYIERHRGGGVCVMVDADGKPLLAGDAE